MKIEPDILKSRGAVLRHYDKNEVIFYEDEPANCFYQIESGSVKMFNSNAEGRLFLQGVFQDGQSFGEPPLFINEPYPSTAVATRDSSILRLNKEDFLELIFSNPSMQAEVIYMLCRRLHSKSITTRDIVNHTPESRIMSFFQHYKGDLKITGKTEIPYTRQMIADFTGLRVETVIRTINRLREEHRLDVINRKIII